MPAGPEPEATNASTSETAEIHRSSRRLQGLPPQYSPLANSARKMATTTATQTEEIPNAAVPCIVNAPRTPNPFHGDAFEDVEDWLDHFDRVATFNDWDDRRKLKNVYFSLLDAARVWYENHEASFTSWQEFYRLLRDAFSTPERKERAEQALSSRFQMPNETVAMFVEDMTRLFRRADPLMPEDKKVRMLMRGVKEQLFAGLVRNPPTTVSQFVREATVMERMLRQRLSQYERQTTMTAACSLVPARDDRESLTELIRQVVREELQRHYGSAPPSAAALTDVIREEIRQVVHPSPPTRTEPPTLSYADALRVSTPSTARFPHPPTGPPRRFPSPSHRTTLQSDFRPGPRKSTVWRAPDNSPLCYHCGEAGHFYRDCHYRRIGLRGYHPDARCPRYGERPQEIEEYLESNRLPPVPQRRQSRSPSPRRHTSPNRARPAFDSTGVTGGSPRRGN